MDYRVFLIGVGLGGSLLAVTVACSGPDPGAITFSERPHAAGDILVTSSSTSTSGGTTSSSGTTSGGTDAGSSGAAITAFSGAPAYTAGSATSPTTVSLPHPAPAPAGMNCNLCHVAAGASPKIWGIGGTVFSALTGGTAVPQAEVRVVDPTGKELAKVYTDTSGNFWAPAFTIPAGSKIGVRNGSTTMLMATPLTGTSAGCAQTGCHASTMQIHLP